MEIKNFDDGQMGLSPSSWPELLASLPIIAGVKLEDTIAACLLQDGKSEAMARVGGHAGPDELADIVLEANRIHPQLNGVILVAYKEVPIDDPITKDFMIQGAMKIIRGGVKVAGIALVGSDGWRVYKQFTEDERGTLDQITVPEEALPYADRALYSDKEVYLPIIQPPEEQSDFLRQMFRVAMEVQAMADEDNLADLGVRERRRRLIEKYDPVTLFERVATEDYESFTMRERCLVAMLWETKSLRDLAIIQYGTSEEHARDMIPRHISDDDASEEDYMSVVGLGLRPEEGRLERVIDFTRKLAGLTLKEPRGTSTWVIQPLTIGGWAAWALGRSTSASELFAIALASVDEGSEDGELAKHLRRMANSGKLPAWAYDAPIL